MAMTSFALMSRSAGANDSTYTRHGYQQCRALPSPHPGIVTKRRCQGVAGIPVIWSADDDSSSVTIGRRPRDEALGLTGFFEAGATIEWRGPASSRPDAAILRYRVGPNVGNLNASKLVIHRLGHDGASCIMAIIDGADGAANTRARDIVDRSAATFRCGVSPRMT